MIFQEKNLVRAIEAIALAGGSKPEEAKLVAENLVIANLTGHDSHGVVRFTQYVDNVLNHEVVPGAPITFAQPFPEGVVPRMRAAQLPDQR